MPSHVPIWIYLLLISFRRPLTLSRQNLAALIFGFLLYSPITFLPFTILLLVRKKEERNSQLYFKLF
jgi:hypothetical protein